MIFTSGCGTMVVSEGAGEKGCVGGGKRPCSLSLEVLIVELDGKRLEEDAMLEELKEGVLPFW